MLSTDFESALAALEAGRAAEAVDVLSGIVDRWPNYAAAQVAYARALRKAGRAEAAFEAWSRAAALVSHSPAVMAGLTEAAGALFGGAGAAPVLDAIDTIPEESPLSEDQEASLTAEDSETPSSPETGPLDPPEPMDLSGAVADERVQEEEPEFVDTPAMDPAFFVPIAKPFDEPGDPEAATEWPGEPLQEESLEEVSEMPEWDGGYAGDAGDGAGSDADLEAPPAEADLDRLIGELESARIVPSDDPSSISPPDLSDDIEDVVSETLARIYATQNQFSEAARVYERLALENPDRADEYSLKASEMRERSK